MTLRTRLTRRRLGAVGAAAVAAMTTLAVTSGGANAAASTFSVFPAPSSLTGVHDAGEPSVGVNWKTGNAMYQSGLRTYRIDLANAGTSAGWKDVSSTLTSRTSLDPILLNDHKTGRTFVSQLAADCSLMAYSDDDGATWTQNPVGCGVAAGADHQTVGGGNWSSSGIGGTGLYPDSAYYCAQAIATAQCSVSRDGGITWGASVPIYSAASCGGLHGHVKVAPDGTAYVPNADCGGQQAAVVSTDNGATWTVRKVPGSKTQDESDPSIAVGSANTTYMGYAQAITNGSAPYVAVTHDRGATWTNVKDVSGGTIKNVQFPTMVSGDDGRAALAFLGTTTAGDDQASSFNGVWHLYVATTTDSGATWTINDVTGSDPVQRGCIWLGGGDNTCRNLLDFMDASVTRDGRVVVGFADGCTAACVTGGANTWDSYATVAVQNAGDLMYAVPQ
jgi:hypothetical protein